MIVISIDRVIVSYANGEASALLQSCTYQFAPEAESLPFQLFGLTAGTSLLPTMGTSNQQHCCRRAGLAVYSDNHRGRHLGSQLVRSLMVFTLCISHSCAILIPFLNKQNREAKVICIVCVPNRLKVQSLAYLFLDVFHK